jgi:hypothetical protein
VSEKSAVHDCRGAVRNPVSLVGVKNRDVECGETGFLESRYYSILGSQPASPSDLIAANNEE